jgi:AcrR family transcriptional regulator
LRVRDVADEAGINNATLHYYFPSKEDLIQGVVEHLLGEFKAGRAPRPQGRPPSAREELRLEFEDTRHLLHQAPETYVVLTELYVRSLRTPGLAGVLRGLEGHWRGYLIGVLRRGVEEGAFRDDLDLDSAASVIMVQIKGLATHAAMAGLPGAEVDRLVDAIAAQTDRWLSR